MVNIIVAVGNYVVGQGYPIGKDGKTPWSNKNDIKWFKDMTTGHPIIMGRKTFESIGHPLPNRTNIVITSREDYWTEYSDIKICKTLEDGIAFAKTINEEVFIIGGSTIYMQAIKNNLVDRVYIDMISEDVQYADAYFPSLVTDELCNDDWQEVGDPIPIEVGKAYAVTYVKCKGKKNHVDEQYFNLVKDVIENGEHKDTRAGKTRSLFGKQLRFNLKEGLPILTTKKVYTKGIIHELLWFLKGDTNIKYLVDNNVHIWDDDAYRYYLELYKEQNDIVAKPYSKETFLNFTRLNSFSDTLKNRDGSTYYYGDLGPIYGKQWTNWNGNNQITNLINTLKNNPDDRRMIISAWNVGDLKYMALPPCHFVMQFYTKKMTLEERINWLNEHNMNSNINENIELLDEWNVPTRKLSCMFNMRSNDLGLGWSFNILEYSILIHLIAQCCNMDVDELIYNCGDCHVYENHIEPLQEQLKRNPHLYALPKLVLNPKITNIDDFTYDDIKIVGYESYPTIKMPLSVGL